MRNYFEFLMKELLTCSKNYNQTKEPVVEEIEEKQVKLEFRKILNKLVINIIEANFENETLMEAELDTKLGYEKSERTSNNDESGLSKNYRNGHSKKTVKTQLGEVTINIPRDRNGEYEPSIIINTAAMPTVWKKKYCRCIHAE